MDTYTKWTDEEWTAVAKRAAALKAAKPDMSWQQIVPVCQDDIPPERRRFTINKLSGLKQMFDILDLDENGNVKPPPPPPAPAPEPEPVPAITAEPPYTPSTKLSDIAIGDLIAEIFARGAALKSDMDRLALMEQSIRALITDNTTKIESVLKRVDEVEGMVMESMDGMDKINKTYTAMLKLSERMEENLEKDGLLSPRPRATSADILPRNGAEPRLAPMRFLVLGPFPKDITRIKERLPRNFNVDLIYGENSDSVKLPANIHYALVSGHNDFTRRWQTVLATYGDKAKRVENGSLGAFVHAIEHLYAAHTQAAA